MKLVEALNLAWYLCKTTFRFVDKSQVYTVLVSLIRELLKDYNPKFVLVVNNPYTAYYRAALSKAQDMEWLKGKLSFKERLEICAQHWVNSIRCAGGSQRGHADGVVRGTIAGV